MQSVEAQFQGSVDFGRRVSLVVPRVGDLMGKTYIQIKFPAAFATAADGFIYTPVDPDNLGDDEAPPNTDNRKQFNVTDNIGLTYDNMYVDEVGWFVIREVEFSIGGQLIDKHYANWLHIWHQLSIPESKRRGIETMVAARYHNYQLSRTMYIPLIFFFNRFESMALPLIALQYHEVRFTVQFEDYLALIGRNAKEAMRTHEDLARPLEPEGPDNQQGPKQLTPIPENGFDATLYIDYIFLDTSERRKFAQSSHEYLICQLQHTGIESLNQKVTNLKLNFNHPVKELVWVFQNNDNYGPDYTVDVTPADLRNDTTNVENHQDASGNNGPNPMLEARLQFNGHDRFSVREGMYFDVVQPYQHHTRVPPSRGINVYSFSLYSEMEQPSGTANFSRIDNATLIFSLKAASDPTRPNNDATNNFVAPTGVYIRMYAVNFNILRIMSGMGGLALTIILIVLKSIMHMAFWLCYMEKHLVSKTCISEEKQVRQILVLSY